MKRSIAWQRLTKKEAINWFIVTLILEDADLNGELSIDTDPTPFLQKVMGNQTIDERADESWPDKKSVYPKKVITIRLEDSIFEGKIRDAAEKIGYRGRKLRGIIDYLRSLPEEGPIGQNRSSTA